MSGKTIDGVSRELLRWIDDFINCGLPLDKEEVAVSAQLRALLDAPAPCAHEWTDDGGHLTVCTACGVQEDHDPGWRDMETAPTDGTMVRLLVDFDEHPTEDAGQAPTIGANNLDNDGEDVWRFAGWCWTHDHFTQGAGTPVGWLPMLADPVVTPAAQPQGEPVAWMYEHDGLVHNEQFKPLFYVNRQAGVQEPWNETALYAKPGAQVPQKYDDTLLPFLALMRKELHANSDKGDREGWLGMSAESALCEIDHHSAKLKHAVHSANAELIKENAADVANCAMMLADVCGVLGRA